MPNTSVPVRTSVRIHNSLKPRLTIECNSDILGGFFYIPQPSGKCCVFEFDHLENVLTVETTSWVKGRRGKEICRRFSMLQSPPRLFVFEIFRAEIKNIRHPLKLSLKRLFPKFKLKAFIPKSFSTALRQARVLFGFNTNSFYSLTI